MTELGGYASPSYELLENLAEALDYAPREEREDALKRYLDCLHATARARGNKPRPKVRVLPKRPVPEPEPQAPARLPYLTQTENTTWRIA
ncbi:hypothetical protein [Nocardia asiatica]